MFSVQRFRNDLFFSSFVTPKRLPHELEFFGLSLSFALRCKGILRNDVSMADIWVWYDSFSVTRDVSRGSHYVPRTAFLKNRILASSSRYFGLTMGVNWLIFSINTSEFAGYSSSFPSLHSLILLDAKLPGSRSVYPLKNALVEGLENLVPIRPACHPEVIVLAGVDRENKSKEIRAVGYLCLVVIRHRYVVWRVAVPVLLEIISYFRCVNRHLEHLQHPPSILPVLYLW